MIFKTAAVALLSSLLIGAASTPARSATVEDKATVRLTAGLEKR
jgi:hypothetical protein